MKGIVFHNQPAATAAWHPEITDKPLVNLNLADHNPLLVQVFSRLPHR